MNLRLDMISCDPATGQSIARDCEEAGWTVSRFDSVEGFIESQTGEPAPLLILSITATWNGGNDGGSLERMKEWRSNDASSQLILFAPEGLAGVDRLALKLGARHTLYYPYETKDLNVILSGFAQGLGKRQQMNEVSRRKSGPEGFEEMIGTSSRIAAVIELARKVGRSNFTSVMIGGENGTGKGALAKAIHMSGERADGPFLEVNCAAIPRNLLESEFFGYEKGAFTDAKERKMGLFELSNGGTIFLDEVGEIDFNLQAKLLKFLDSRTIRRISGTQFLPVDVRIICATNRDLKTLIEQKRFRADLYYRLNVIEIIVPPLRERVEDIRPIAGNYIALFSKRMKKGDIRITEEALRLMESYSWPGNIRELINMIERAVLLDSRGEIRPEDLPIKKEEQETILNITEQEGTIRIELPSRGASLEEIEKGAIIAALRSASGNVTRAADLLKVERGTLRYKMKKHGIDASNIKENVKTGEYEPVAVTD